MYRVGEQNCVYRRSFDRLFRGNSGKILCAKVGLAFNSEYRKPSALTAIEHRVVLSHEVTVLGLAPTCEAASSTARSRSRQRNQEHRPTLTASLRNPGGWFPNVCR